MHSRHTGIVVKLFAGFPAALSILGLVSCSSVWVPEESRSMGSAADRGTTQTRTYDYSETGRTATPALPSRAPWELFVHGSDFNGSAITNYEILRGDEFLKGENLSEALKSYQLASKTALSPSEKLALVYRIGSTELRANNWKQALSSVSGFFTSQGMQQEEVPGRFGLLLAFSYGALGNVDQSLAWFSLAYRAGNGEAAVSSVARSGVASLVRQLPENQLDDLARVWASDGFINSGLARERARRAYPNVASPLRFAGGAFWNNYEFAIDGDDRGPLNLGDARILVMLPLTGRHASLGKQVRSGIELALLARSSPGLRVEYLDTQGDTLEAVSRLQQELSTSGGGGDIVLGPLLSEVAVSASEATRYSQTPMVVFSKRTSFPIGGNVFRLGATVESQVDSLLDTAINRMKLYRFALVYPETALGEHYAEMFKSKSLSYGAEIAYETSFPESDSASLVLVSQEIEAVKVDAIFLPTSLQVASNFWTNMPPLVRDRVRLLGPANWYNPVAIKNALGAIDGTAFVSPYFLESQRPVVQKFNQAFRNQFGLPPDFLAAQGFDAATLALAALERTASSELGVSDALRQIQAYEGLTGSMSVLQNGEVIRKFPIVEVVSGELREVPLDSDKFQYTFRGNERVESAYRDSSPRAQLAQPRGAEPAFEMVTP